ncbi:MAG: Uma2 family endonuclease [Xenococcus sp. (in: cyanobacteria)]
MAKLKILQNNKALDFFNESQDLLINNTEIDKDQIKTLDNVTWEEYEDLLAVIGDIAWCRISYLDGVLELMCPGIRHENIKEIIGILIVTYCDYKEIDYIPMGSTTYKAKIGKSGKEPDLSYAIGEYKEIPDLAVEINFSSGSIKDLEKYKKLGIKEVWVWDKKNELKIYYLINSEYQEKNSSFFVKGINLQIMKKYILLMNQDKRQTRLYKKQFISEITSDNPESFS